MVSSWRTSKTPASRFILNPNPNPNLQDARVQVHYGERERNELTGAVLKLCQQMLEFGLYESIEQLRELVEA